MNVVPSWKKTEDSIIFLERFLSVTCPSVVAVTLVIQTRGKDQNEGLRWTCPHELVHPCTLLTLGTQQPEAPKKQSRACA